MSIKQNKKGIEMTMQLIVIVIILLALLVFMLVFLTGQGGKVTALWENITIGAVQSAGP